jgi:hypothetical protein
MASRYLNSEVGTEVRRAKPGSGTKNTKKEQMHLGKKWRPKLTQAERWTENDK